MTLTTKELKMENLKTAAHFKQIETSDIVSEREAKWRHESNAIYRFKGNTERIQVGMSLGKLLSPIIIGGIIVLLFLGFGSTVILQIIGSMNIWLWLIAITIFIILMRKRR
jgi:hypothetical protein